MDQNANVPKGANFLKVCGILMIIGGVASIILGLVGLIGAAAFAALEVNTGALTLSAIVAIAAGVLELIAGIIGVKHCKEPAKANTCIVWGIIVAALSLAGQIISISNGGKFDFVSCLTGLVVPILFIIGAFLNKKA